MNVIKSCSTCEHREGKGEYARCRDSGFYITVTRRYPGNCDSNYSRWVPRTSLWQRIKLFFVGAQDAK